MKKRILFSLIISLFLVTGYSQTAEEWQADLRHLQQTVHQKYPNLFYNVTLKDWDKVVDEFHQQIPSMEKHKIIAGFTKLVAMFYIGHTQVNTWGMHGGGGAVALNRIPVQFYWFSDGLYIISADKKYEQAVGGKIVKIGNLKTEEALNAIKPLVSFENEQGFRNNSMFFLGVPEFLNAQGITDKTTEVQVKYLKNGKEETITLSSSPPHGFFNNTGLETAPGWVTCKNYADTPLWQKQPKAFRYMEYSPTDKSLYVRHSVTLNDGNNTIAAFFNNMAEFIDKNDVLELILDIRMNGGGNNYLNKPIITNIIASKKINHKGKFFA